MTSALPRIMPLFSRLCVLLPMAVAVVLCLLHGPRVFVWLLLIVAAIPAFLLSLWVLLLHPSTIRLNDEGIRFRRRVHPWDEIVKIDKRRLRARPIVLVMKGRRRILLPPWPVVVRDILPELVRRCPAATVTKRARRLLADPRRAEASRGVVPGLLCLAAALVAFPVLVRYGEFWTVGIPYLMALGTCAVLAFLVWPPHTEAMRMAWGAGVPIPAILLVYIVMASDAPVRTADALCAVMATLAVAAAILHGLRIQPGRRGQAAILCAALAAGGLAYGAAAWREWPREDITALLKVDRPLAPFPWSDDGRKVLVNSMANYARDDREQQVVADLSAGTTTVLPVHEDASVTARLAPTCVVRYVKPEGGEETRIYLYRFADGREVLLSSNPKSSYGFFGPPASPTGRAVCWLEKAETTLLKVHDVSTGRTRTLNVAWPTEKGIEWREAIWINEQTIGVVGFERDEEKEAGRGDRLHTLRVHIKDMMTEHLVAPRALRYGFPSPDLTRAFASARDGIVCYVDLRTGRTQPMGGGDVPVWGPDGRRAFRLINRGSDEPWLAIFDTATSTETPVLKIPANSVLVDVSPRGRFALLRRGRTAMRPLVVVDLASGRHHVLNTPASTMVCALIMGFHWDNRSLGESYWSPDGRRIVVQSLGLEGKRGVLRTWLYTVPDGWP